MKIYAKQIQSKENLYIYINDIEINFKLKALIQIHNKFVMMIISLVYQEDNIVLDLYASHNKVSKYKKATYEKINRLDIGVGGFNIFHSGIDRLRRPKKLIMKSKVK